MVARGKPVVWSDDEVQAAVYCASEVVRSRVLKGQPVPRWLAAHHREMEARWSRLRQEIACGGKASDDQHVVWIRSAPDRHEVWIGVREAGRILGRSQRQVQRTAVSLGGERVGGRWLFRRTDIEQHAEVMGR